MATDNDNPKHITINIPQALIIAVVTALASGGATRCSAADMPADTRGELREIRRELSEIKASERVLLDAVNQNAQDSKNRDTVQDATIAALRNR